MYPSPSRPLARTNLAPAIQPGPAGGYVGTTLGDYADFAQVSVLQWPGVDPTGATDSTPGLQAAINWAEAQSPRAHLYLPPGSYQLTSALIINKAIGFCADTPFSATLVTNGTYSAISAAMASSTEYGLKICVGIKNIASSPASGDGIRINLAYYADVSVSCSGYYNSLHLTQFNLSDVRLIDSGFINVSLLVDGGNNFNSNVYCVISGASVGAYGIKLQDQVDEWYFRSVISSCVVGLYTDATSYVVNARPEFCVFDLGIDSCTTSGMDLSHCYDMYFSSGFFSNRPGRGCIIGVRSTTENVRFGMGCNGFFCGQEIYYIGVSAIGTIIEGICGNGSQASSGTYPNIRAAAGCSNFKINVRLYNDPDVTAEPSNLILVEATGSANYQILGSDVSQAASTGAAILDNRNGAGRLVNNNLGYVTHNSGTAILTGGTSSVVVTHGLAVTPATANIRLQPGNPLPAGVGLLITAIGSTTFTVSMYLNNGTTVAPTTQTADLGVYWDAFIQGDS